VKDETVGRWERTYTEEGKRWGDEPGALARLAVEILRAQRAGAVDRPLRLLDVGCGYGRDAAFLARELGAAVVGIDPAAPAVELARRQAPRDLALDYRRCVIEDVDDGPFGVVFAANVYHVLKPAARLALAARSFELLPAGGWFFLSTLASGDPEHSGHGLPVQDDEGSLVDAGKYLHLSSAEALRDEFGHFEIVRLVRHAFHEPHADGSAHDHVHWLLAARRP
jgi:SAM-dependent methyltransferase